MTGIKETKELLIAIEHLASDVQKAVADGQFTLLDIRYFIEAIPYLKDAVQDMALIKNEVRDLDKDEMVELFDMLVEMAVIIFPALVPELEKKA